MDSSWIYIYDKAAYYIKDSSEYVHLFKVMFHVCCLYLRPVFGLVPGVRSMTGLGAALLVLNKGEKKFTMGDKMNTDVT